jgi:TRAP-type C4-dicarboxylate transport system permease small subunit
VNPLRIAAIVLIAGGVIGLAYGSFTYVTESHDVDLGVVDLSWKDRETVNVPVWAGIAGIAAGAVILFARKTP